ncbi:MAG: hypothetical protein JSR58_02110 [Verrucomicrobia bacterium]|nr:hypothetical protein [Verrucomicrobiota bacterium]
MDNKEFKNLFKKIAENHGFTSAFNGWCKESEDCLFIMDLQKSNFGNFYHLNLKTFIKGIFGRTYSIGKDLVKKDMGQIFRQQPPEFDRYLNLETIMDNAKREQGIETLFTQFILPYSKSVSTLEDIQHSAQAGHLHLLPAVDKELERLISKTP